jgi:hypothetical protein
MKNLLTVLLCTLLVTACTPFEEPEMVSVEQTEIESQPLTRAGAVVSDQNPYSLSNVQEAYNDLRTSLGLPAKNIAASHHYVRFDIQDSLMYKTVHDDLGLELIEYPLDRELTVAEMNVYMNDMSNTWYYTVVPVGFPYPQGVDHEFLDYVYMQGEPATRAPGDTPQIDDVNYDLIIEKAMQNNGVNVAPLTRGAAWYPSATIQFQDDYNDTTIPLEGVKVRCTHFINVGSGTTDENGNVSGIKGWGGKFRNPVGYHIIWDDPKWNIRDGRTGQAKTHGPKQKSHWNKTITNNDTKDSFFTAVHRALWSYFYETYPLTYDITKARIDKMDTGVLWDKDHPKRVARFTAATRTLGGNLILAYGKENGSYRERWEVTSSVFHELGHATHWQAVVDKRGANRWSEYINASDILLESWARGVESSYMRAIYTGHLQGRYFGDYTAVVESMMNQGMTLKQIEDALVGESEWNNWRSNVLATGYIPAQIVNMIFSDAYLYDPLRVNLTNPITSITDKPVLNTSVTYSVPAPPSGVTFTNWTVTPSTFVATGGTNNRNLTVRFTAAGTYTLSANFTLPNNTTYSATRTVNVVNPLAKPQISWDKYVVWPGETLTCTVANPDFSAVYDWELDGVVWARGWGPNQSLLINHHYLNDPSATIRCRARIGSQVSEWSNPILVYVSDTPPYRAPAPNKDEEEEGEEEEKEESAAEQLSV